MGSVQREGEYAWIVAKNSGGAIPLVDVAVDDRRALDRSVSEQHARRYRNVVEDAVALAAIGERVMRAAGEVCRKAPGLDGDARRGKRRADRTPRTLDHLRRPRKPNRPLERVRHRTRCD